MLVVDAANVIGSRPNGWWRDRAGAAASLCDDLRSALGAGRIAAPVVVVLEGAARAGVDEQDANGLRIVHAAGSGDDTIAAIAASSPTAETAATASDTTRGTTVPVTVVTADRGLRDRVRATGCQTVGPRWLLDRL